MAVWGLLIQTGGVGTVSAVLRLFSGPLTPNAALPPT